MLKAIIKLLAQIMSENWYYFFVDRPRTHRGSLRFLKYPDWYCRRNLEVTKHLLFFFNDFTGMLYWKHRNVSNETIPILMTYELRRINVCHTPQAPPRPPVFHTDTLTRLIVEPFTWRVPSHLTISGRCLLVAQNKLARLMPTLLKLSSSGKGIKYELWGGGSCTPRGKIRGFFA